MLVFYSDVCYHKLILSFFVVQNARASYDFSSNDPFPYPRYTDDWFNRYGIADIVYYKLIDLNS